MDPTELNLMKRKLISSFPRFRYISGTKLLPPSHVKSVFISISANGNKFNIDIPSTHDRC